MKCKTVQKYIPDYISGDLDEIKAEALEKHIKECSECSEVFRFFESYLKESKSIKTVKAPEDFEARLIQKIAAKPEKITILDRIKMPFPFKIPVEAIGLAAIAVVVFFFWKPYESVKKTYTEFDKTISEEIETAKKPAPAEPASQGARRLIKPQSKTPEIKKMLAPEAAPADQESATVADESIRPTIEKDTRNKNISTSNDSKLSEEEIAVLPASVSQTIVFNLTLKNTIQQKEERTDDGQPTASVQEAKKRNFLTRQSAPAQRPSDAAGKPVRSSISNNEDAVINAVKKTGGTVIETVKHNSGVMMYYVIEVPYSNYESFFKEISKIGTLTKSSGQTPDPNKKKIRIRINLQ